MKNNHIFLFIILFVIFGGGTFYGGMKYQQGLGSGNADRGLRSGMIGRELQNGGRSAGGFRSVNGDIISVDDTSITVKMLDGSSRIVLITDKTTINKAAAATKVDLISGEKVAVFGNTNADGSVTAQSIQLNPVSREFGGRNASASSSVSSK